MHKPCWGRCGITLENQFGVLNVELTKTGTDQKEEWCVKSGTLELGNGSSRRGIKLFLDRNDPVIT